MQVIPIARKKNPAINGYIIVCRHCLGGGKGLGGGGGEGIGGGGCIGFGGAGTTHG